MRRSCVSADGRCDVSTSLNMDEFVADMQNRSSTQIETMQNIDMPEANVRNAFASVGALLSLFNENSTSVAKASSLIGHKFRLVYRFENNSRVLRIYSSRFAQCLGKYGNFQSTWRTNLIVGIPWRIVRGICIEKDSKGHFHAKHPTCVPRAG